MTAMSKIRNIDAEAIKQYFRKEDYRKALLVHIDDKVLEYVRGNLDIFLQEYEPYINRKKIFCYKLGETVVFEIYIHPYDTSKVISIKGKVSVEGCEIKKVLPS